MNRQVRKACYAVQLAQQAMATANKDIMKLPCCEYGVPFKSGPNCTSDTAAKCNEASTCSFPICFGIVSRNYYKALHASAIEIPFLGGQHNSVVMYNMKKQPKRCRVPTENAQTFHITCTSKTKMCSGTDCVKPQQTDKHCSAVRVTLCKRKGGGNHVTAGSLSPIAFTLYRYLRRGRPSR